MAWVHDSQTGDCATGTGGTRIKVLCFWDSTAMAWKPMGICLARRLAPQTWATLNNHDLSERTLNGQLRFSEIQVRQ